MCTVFNHLNHWKKQLTGALSHVLPIMICVMTSKWVGDAMGKDGIYSVWIAMRRYPWLPPVDYHDRGLTGANLMKPLSQVVVIEDGVTTVGDLKKLLASYEFHGFPVIDNHREFVGFATRQELRAALGKFFFGLDWIYIYTVPSITQPFLLRVLAD